MIKLFEIDDKYELQLNKEWIMMIPAFAEIVKKDKGSEGDYRGDKKLMAKKKLGFVYLMVDFASPLRELEKFTKRERALEHLSLTERDLNDPDLANAMAYYEKLQFENARSLRTLIAVKRGLDSMDNYFEHVDFEKVDKQGKLLYSPKEYVANITEVKKAYQSLSDLEESIMEQLTQADLIRGDVDLGDMEENRNRFQELLTQADGAARTKALAALTPDEDIDLTKFDPDKEGEDEVYKVVDRPATRPITGPSFAGFGDQIKVFTEKYEPNPTEAEEAEEDGLS